MGQKPSFLLSTTRDEMLSWMIEIWTKHHLVSDGNCNVVNLESPLKKIQKERQIMLGEHFVFVTTTPRFTISIEPRPLGLATLNITLIFI